ncbi:beauvericin cluster-specific repressor BEA4 [Trichoderma asperellum]|uniref:Beauvericin cluster-specific repressor BEA4 n=1 Tax=Trichoderma asperellum TaxID=101201 RepID=A0A6V8QK11_TRIAP|nr:hypothetical protein LI328DRAFT_155143 [Trichoderma asperelloides]GFP52821.1 beauvericin cluster-specific repressor BEA4 [Trichoderma asperellum]
MVNVAGRSRGCATCRKRRVKCDQSLPECLRCLGMGLKCPGARTDAFFVHTVVPDASLRDSSSAAATAIRSTSSHKTMMMHLPQLPSWQPSRADAFDQLFVSHFIDCFFGRARPSLPLPHGTSKIWLHELPEFLASPYPSPVQCSIRAASMLSYGTVTGDVSIKAEACRWYMRALQSLRYLLSLDDSGSSLYSPESTVCAAVMLIHFETTAGTSPKAWLPHVNGAASLLEAQGPERCRDGFMHQIFRHLRLQTFVAAMADNRLHPFASPQWTTVPFEKHPKLIFDHLIDVLFAVLRCLSTANDLISSDVNHTRQLQAKLNNLIQDARLQIHEWRSEAMFYTTGRQDDQSASVSETEQDIATSLDPRHFMLPYTDIPSAALVSFYDAANIIVLRLLHLVSPTASLYNARIRQHTQSILSAHEMISEKSSPEPGRGSIMMVQQLKIAALWSASSQQRAVAVNMLRGFRKGGFAGISAPSHEYFADVATHILHNHPVEAT